MSLLVLPGDSWERMRSQRVRTLETAGRCKIRAELDERGYLHYSDPV